MVNQCGVHLQQGARTKSAFVKPGKHKDPGLSGRIGRRHLRPPFCEGGENTLQARTGFLTYGLGHITAIINARRQVHLPISPAGDLAITNRWLTVVDRTCLSWTFYLPRTNPNTVARPWRIFTAFPSRQTDHQAPLRPYLCRDDPSRLIQQHNIEISKYQIKK